MRRFILLISALVLVSCGAVSSLSAPDPTPRPSGPHIGTTVELGNWRYRVVQVDTAPVISYSAYSSEKAKGLWVLVMIDLTNLANENFTINETDFELRDDKAIHYNPAWLTSALYSQSIGQAALGEQMPPGVTVRSTILFDVAPGTNGMYLFLVQGKGVVRLE